MLWEIDIYPASGEPDRKGISVVHDAKDLGIENITVQTAHGYLVQGNLDESQVQLLAKQLFADDVAERFVIALANDAKLLEPIDSQVVYVLPKPGVTDPVAESAMKAIVDFNKRTLGLPVTHESGLSEGGRYDPLSYFRAESIRTFKKYWISGTDDAGLRRLCTKLLANDAIEQTVVGALPFERLDVGSNYLFHLATVPIRTMNDDELMILSKKGQLYLSLTEMKTIQQQFEKEGRDPTDIELETVAQTWSEHCSHKTLAGRIRYQGPDGERRFENMLKETIFAATQTIRKNADTNDICVSVFADNAGVVKFDDEYNVCFKVETHNHPSALEPYGGSNTGLGGVIRDTMGVGMGAKPIASTDVFCFGELNVSTDELPPGILHPRRIMKGVVSGVRDYGNRMGIPTINGAIYFDKRYIGNPLVYCGNIGIIPCDMSFKKPMPNDWIVAVGGRTGRDGIHGATFSSAELTSESDSISGGAVQIGNAITEKMVLDVLLEARDRGLFTAVTDCGAGGFSSAVGEMGEKIGAEVDLENAPLKYQGLSYAEIWISEAQERMVLSVPPEKRDELETLCASEGVETVKLGVFKPTGRLHLKYHGTTVADLDMKFLHDGRPPVVRDAVYILPETTPLQKKEASGIRHQASGESFEAEPGAWSPEPEASLLKILAAPNVASKHWIVRQYDHEVQGGSVVKPLVGVKNDGPGDASVVRPRLTSNRGLVVSCGMNPYYGDHDTYQMAASAIDEAIRNAVAVGCDPSTIVLLDNFCWGNTERAETLGSLVRAATACHDVAIAFGTPFVSGKDSLNNEFRPEGAAEPITIPPSLLISAMGQVDDVRTCITMDLKTPGNLIYIIGETKNELGGSHYALVEGMTGGQVPTVDVFQAKKTFEKLHQVIKSGTVRSCHDLSEGGFAVAMAEMCFAGGFGVTVALEKLPNKLDDSKLDAETNHDIVLLYSESNSRFLCEVTPENAANFETALDGVPRARIGIVTGDAKLTILSGNKTVIDKSTTDLHAAWKQTLDF
ncbi:MAG: phosphoribosylformylglycinamidine synthase subunit PurL [Planctomycetaceae bacterium]|nr:phosphoribosylformylglycinamidine synthase subunit PurL [Planctomycetaceae bacterium]